jgi:hypothetical protein
MADTVRTRKQPLDFRKEEVGRVMERWRASESCSLIGVGSVGKSNLLQHLADTDVQAFYMEVAKVEKFKAIIIDPSLLGPLPIAGVNMDQVRCWAGYELMMHRLFLAFYPFEMLTKDEAKQYIETYQALQDGTNPLYAYMGLRYFELGLEFFLRQGIQIVFMFDEFEEMMRQLPVKFFQTLRGIRDINKGQLSYLTFTRSPILEIGQQQEIPLLAIEPFAELFTDNVYYVGPYNESDARQMVEGLLKRNQKTYDDYIINFLLWATGRYAGLLRAGFRALDSLGNLEASHVMTSVEQLVQQLATRRGIRSECRTIWTSLNRTEQYVLRAVAGLNPSVDTSDPEIGEAVALLVQKRLLRVNKEQKQLIIEPPVFYTYVSDDSNATPQ